MLKIYNSVKNVAHVWDTIFEGLLDYAPGDSFREVFEIQEADIIMLQGKISEGSEVPEVNLPDIDFSLANIGNAAKIANVIDNAHRMMWLDPLGPTLCKNKKVFESLKETDIVICPATLPPHKNTFTNAWHIEKSVFKRYSRFERVKGSVMMSHDNLFPEIDWFVGVMDAVSDLSVTKSQTLGDEIEEAMGKFLDKVSCQHLSYPKGIAYTASACEFVLHTHTTFGAELMGIEAGMTGCQPIYPDTELYRDIFDFDGSGVVFYDTDNAVDSIKSIISEGSTFTDEQVAAFREKFSAEDNLPSFWQQVAKVVK